MNVFVHSGGVWRRRDVVEDLPKTFYGNTLFIILWRWMVECEVVGVCGRLLDCGHEVGDLRPFIFALGKVLFGRVGG